MNDPPTNGTIRGFAMNGVDECSICYSLIERFIFKFSKERSVYFISRDTIEVEGGTISIILSLILDFFRSLRIVVQNFETFFWMPTCICEFF